MLPDRVSNPGPLTYESGALPIALRGPASSASGCPLKEYGIALFRLRLITLELEREVIVADIENEGLLGMDVLFQDSEGPADILLSEGINTLNGVSIPCIQVGLTETGRKVTAAEDFVVPGNLEMLVDMFIERG